ncbi:hypothetical protein CVT25_012545 [Psilocybe cyanescens]|uniref:Uncharacterized protein n=1 Tax=Psilocybe cyanescens TaxID=93625 RepID=A0A409X0Z2_PSICY|nr:hypothetical protein CVT25_012545 [Psilocybe cyanescens]
MPNFPNESAFASVHSPTVSNDALALAAEHRTLQATSAVAPQLSTLLTISENMLRDPTNPKFQMFRSGNSIIKRELIDTKDILEYTIEVGCDSSIHAVE